MPMEKSFIRKIKDQKEQECEPGSLTLPSSEQRDQCLKQRAVSVQRGHKHLCSPQAGK